MLKSVGYWNIGLGFFHVLFLAACSTLDKKTYLGTTQPRHPPNEVWINNSTEPQHIDPQLATGVPDSEIASNIFARLVQIHPLTGKPVPDLARRWSVSKDGTEFTFYLRKNSWSDGHPLTAHDVEYAWKRLIDPATGAEYASTAYNIINAEPFNQKALFVSGGGSSSAKAIEAMFSKVVPVDKVLESETPSGVFVFIGGDPEEAEAHRKKAIRTFHGRAYGKDVLKVSITDASMVQIKVLDDDTLWVKLNGPLPYFLHLLEFGPFAPVPKHVIERVKKTVKPGQEEAWTRAENIVCSNAFCLSEEKFKQYKIFKKNPYYWDSQMVRIEKIKVLSIESYNTTVSFYQTGEIDWIGNGGQLPSEYIKFIKHLKDYHNDPYLGVYYYGFNVGVKPLNDKRVRQALSMSVDRRALTQMIGGGQLPYASMVPDGLAGYKGLNLPLFEPEKAKKLLAEAGFRDGKNFPRLRLMYNTTELHKQIAEAIQQMWKQNLNIDIQLQNKEWKVYLDDMNSRSYDIVRRGWIGDYPDPYTFLELMLSTCGNNRTGWANKTYDTVLQFANRQFDLTKRLDMLRQAEEIGMEHMPFLPIFVYTSLYLKKPFLKGFWPDIQNHHFWKHWWIDERWYHGVPATEIEDLPRITVEDVVS